MYNHDGSRIFQGIKRSYAFQRLIPAEFVTAPAASDYIARKWTVSAVTRVGMLNKAPSKLFESNGRLEIGYAMSKNFGQYQERAAGTI
ncbi:MAG: hypothetical protein ACSHXK_16665 [Oceanococcus sp.]